MFYRMSNKLKPAINVNWRVICRRSLFYFRINTSWRYYLEQFGTCLLQPILYQCSLKFDWFPVFCSICCVSRYLPTITRIPWQFTHFVPMLPCIYFNGFQYLAVFLAEMLVNEGICTKWRNFRPGMIKLESIEINGNIAQNVFINFFVRRHETKIPKQPIREDIGVFVALLHYLEVFWDCHENTVFLRISTPGAYLIWKPRFDSIAALIKERRLFRSEGNELWALFLHRIVRKSPETQRRSEEIW